MIDEALRNAAKRGDLNYVSLAFCVADGLFEASYRGTRDKDFRVVRHADPATALAMALTGKRAATVAAQTKAAPKAPRPAVTTRASGGAFDDLLG